MVKYLKKSMTLVKSEMPCFTIQTAVLPGVVRKTVTPRLEDCLPCFRDTPNLVPRYS